MGRVRRELSLVVEYGICRSDQGTGNQRDARRREYASLLNVAQSNGRQKEDRNKRTDGRGFWLCLPFYGLHELRYPITPCVRYRTSSDKLA